MGEWKVGLFGCFGNTSLCVAAFCAPFLVLGKAAEANDENGALWAMATAASPVAAAYLRFKIREKAGIEGSCVKDCLIFCCCPCCATYQMASETGAVDYLLDIPPEQQIERMASS